MEPYKVVELKSDANEQAITEAYPRFVFLHHPDRADPDLTAKFPPIDTAYETVSRSIPKAVSAQQPLPA